MGSGSSKRVQKKSTVVISAASAFDDAGKRRVAAKGNQETQNNNGATIASHVSLDSKNDINTGGSTTPINNGIVPSKEKSASQRQEPESSEDKLGGGDTVDTENGELSELAVLRIQSVFRGHHERQLIKKQSEMAIKIQRRFRKHLSEVSNSGEKQTTDESGQNKENDEEIPKQAILEQRRENRENRAREWRDDTPELLRKEYKAEIGEKTKEEFNLFQDEITDLKWKSEQQIERNVYLDGSSPRRVLFISSNIQKSKLLAEARLEDVITFDYNFVTDTFEGLIQMLETHLRDYKEGAKARSICFVCQGGPGHLYLLKKRALTSPKLKKESEADQVRFWKSIGQFMSKVNYQESVIHIMGCNVLGNDKGQQLFDDLEAIMLPSLAKIKAPLELSPEGQDMIGCYFDKPKYTTWKMRRYSKTE